MTFDNTLKIPFLGYLAPSLTSCSHFDCPTLSETLPPSSFRRQPSHHPFALINSSLLAREGASVLPVSPSAVLPFRGFSPPEQGLGDSLLQSPTAPDLPKGRELRHSQRRTRRKTLSGVLSTDCTRRAAGREEEVRKWGNGGLFCYYFALL